MEKLLRAPLKYVQDRGMLNHLLDYVDEKYFRIVLIVDDYVLKNLKQQLLSSFKDYEVVILSVSVCTVEVIKDLIRNYDITPLDLTFGVGGGKVMDVAKGISYFSDSEVILVPSIASTDAPCSSLSALYYEDGSFDRYLYAVRSPLAVFADVELIANAPIRYLIAGIGDALSTYVEAKACYESKTLNCLGYYVTYSALMIAKASYESIMLYARKAIEDIGNNKISEAVENIIETNIYLSGIGFESGGLSIAHSLHNALTKVKSSKQNLHGEIVAYTTLVQLVCNEDEKMFNEAYKLCKDLGLPLSLKNLGMELNEELFNIIDENCFANHSLILNVPYMMSIDKLKEAMQYLENYTIQLRFSKYSLT